VKEILDALVAEMLEQKVRLDEALEEFEKQFLQTALARSGGNQCKASQILHIHRNTLARKIAQPKSKVTDESGAGNAAASAAIISMYVSVHFTVRLLSQARTVPSFRWF
jgi:predicted DNA-binding protein (UPF0251 family)